MPVADEDVDSTAVYAFAAFLSAKKYGSGQRAVRNFEGNIVARLRQPNL
jgi:hypothetical protein